MRDLVRIGIDPARYDEDSMVALAKIAEVWHVVPPVAPGDIDDGWPDEWALAIALGIFFLAVALGVLAGSALA